MSSSATLARGGWSRCGEKEERVDLFSDFGPWWLERWRRLQCRLLRGDVGWPGSLDGLLACGRLLRRLAVTHEGSSLTVFLACCRFVVCWYRHRSERWKRKKEIIIITCVHSSLTRAMRSAMTIRMITHTANSLQQSVDLPEGESAWAAALAKKKTRSTQDKSPWSHQKKD